ncbi:MAG: sulfatase-like hydrolase/transferase [Chthoniobacterales bacterium]
MKTELASRLRPNIPRILSVVGVALAALATATGEDRSDKPNIIFFLADDMPLQSFGVYGNSTSFDTPVIDELAKTGLTFTHCFSATWCTPSRSLLLSGKYLNTERGDHVPTFANLMREAGYKTAITGKWMVGGMRMAPDQRGFDEALLQMNFYAYWLPDLMVWNSGGYLKEINQPIDHVQKDEWAVEPGGGVGKVTRFEGEYAPDMICNFAIDFINRNAGSPFFLYYPFKLPHYPFPPTPDSEGYTEDQKLIDLYKEKELGEYILTYLERIGKVKEINIGHQEYAKDMVEYMDKMIGRVLAKLEEEGLRENTLIVFASDNGCMLPGKLNPGEEWLPGRKGKPGELGIRVPLIVNWPARTEPDRRSDDLIDFVDFLPTFVDAAGGTLPEGEEFDGVSFLPQIEGKTGTPRAWVFNSEGGAKRMVRSQRYKLYPDGRFYDMVTDVAEKNPIAEGEGSSEAEAKRRELKGALDELNVN